MKILYTFVYKNTLFIFAGVLLAIEPWYGPQLGPVFDPLL